MKIVHIITRLCLGGAQENTLLTCRLLASRGHDVTLVTGPAPGPEGDMFGQAAQDGYRVEIIPQIIRPIWPFADALAYIKLCNLIRDIDPDIVHTHSAKAGILGRFAAAAVRGRSRRPAIIHTIHGLAFHRYQNAILNRFYITVEKAAAARTDQFISVAAAMTRQARAAGIGRNRPFVTAYSAFDEELFTAQIPVEQLLEFRRRHGIPENAVVLVTVARLFELKGHEYIIRSARDLARRHGRAFWLFVGDGSLAGEIRRQIAEYGLAERIKFTGLLPPRMIPLALQSCDILVHCSLREGLARAIGQAMLCGRPVVSFDVDGAAEVVSEKTGRLIAPCNVDQLIAACDELIADGQLRLRLGKMAMESVREKFMPERMVDIIEDVYRAVTRTVGSP